jgi:hypothetical protein
MTRAETAYEAYRKHTGGVSLISGQPIPPFSELSEAIQGAWAAAAAALDGAARRAGTTDYTSLSRICALGQCDLCESGCGCDCHFPQSRDSSHVV